MSERGGTADGIAPRLALHLGLSPQIIQRERPPLLVAETTHRRTPYPFTALFLPCSLLPAPHRIIMHHTISGLDHPVAAFSQPTVLMLHRRKQSWAGSQ